MALSISTVNTSEVRQLKKTSLHPYHIVDPSPWPLVVSLGAFFIVLGLVLYRHSFTLGLTLFSLGLLATITNAAF